MTGGGVIHQRGRSGFPGPLPAPVINSGNRINPKWRAERDCVRRTSRSVWVTEAAGKIERGLYVRRCCGWSFRHSRAPGKGGGAAGTEATAALSRRSEMKAERTRSGRRIFN